MQHVDLPRAIEDYFAHAEIAPLSDGRRFSITLPYMNAGKLDRIQWWWSIGKVQQQILGDDGLAAHRARAVERFQLHIGRWLANTGQRLVGDGPIPVIETLPKVAAPALAVAEPESPVNEVAWPGDKVANG
jgi:hypothetical protein